MAVVEKVPTFKFVSALLATPSISQLLEDFPLENDYIAAQLTLYYEKLGIYEVDPISQRKLIANSIKIQLFNNHGIHRKILELKRAQEEQNSRKRRQGLT